MKAKVNRTPTDLLDDLSIFIYNLRAAGYTLMNIAHIVKKDHSTVLYHIRKYDGLSKFNQEFKNRIKTRRE
ncbi:hypothetical protein [Chryseobacterium indologenes]|uniref:hypothetical protein n=1 Tax=Chryseobacterium indologenes TaxID=253 RepID=UPI0030172AF1